MDPLGWGQGVVPEAGFQGFASRLELDWGTYTKARYVSNDGTIRTMYYCSATTVSDTVEREHGRERQRRKKEERRSRRDKMDKGRSRGQGLDSSILVALGLSTVCVCVSCQLVSLPLCSCRMVHRPGNLVVLSSMDPIYIGCHSDCRHTHTRAHTPAPMPSHPHLP